MLTTQPKTKEYQFVIHSIFAKIKGDKEIYKIELKYKMDGKFILRPISGIAYKNIYATAEQLKNKTLFEMHPHFMLVEIEKE